MVTEIEIPIGEISIDGTLAVPANASGLVMFAHGSGSSRHSPRNRHVAALLGARGLATLLFDLLTADEEQIDAVTGTLRFDIDLLADRLTAATDSLVTTSPIRGLPIGYFGSSTGAAAALIAAARRPALVGAVVSRGGRVDLAASSLAVVRAPTLMIVGGADPWVLGVNRDAASRMRRHIASRSSRERPTCSRSRARSTTLLDSLATGSCTISARHTRVERRDFRAIGSRLIGS